MLAANIHGNLNICLQFCGYFTKEKLLSNMKLTEIHKNASVFNEFIKVKAFNTNTVVLCNAALFSYSSTAGRDKMVSTAGITVHDVSSSSNAPLETFQAVASMCRSLHLVQKELPRMASIMNGMGCLHGTLRHPQLIFCPSPAMLLFYSQ